MKKYLTSAVLSMLSIAAFAQAPAQEKINQVNGGMPNRISMNVTVAKQTQGNNFGEKVNQGLHAAGSVVANGALVEAKPGQPIGGIIVKGGSLMVDPANNNPTSPATTEATEHRTYTGGRRNETEKGITQSGINKNTAISPGQPIGGIVVKGGTPQ